MSDEEKFKEIQKSFESNGRANSIQCYASGYVDGEINYRRKLAKDLHKITLMPIKDHRHMIELIIEAIFK
jgi:hypothetical protein